MSFLPQRRNIFANRAKLEGPNAASPLPAAIGLSTNSESGAMRARAWMPWRRTVKGIVRAVLVGVATLASAGASALAADLAPEPAPVPQPTLPSTWHFEATIDGWAPSLNANVGVRALPTLTVAATIFQILPHLEGYIPLSAVAFNDTFIVGADVFWVRLGSLGGSFKPGDGSLGGVHADLTLNESFATGYGGVRIPTANPDWSVYGILGARYFNLNGTVTLGVPGLGFSRTTSQGKDWVDEIVGVKARHRIDDKWFLDFEGDVGGYHASATTQGYAAVGYKWNQSISTSLGFRVLYSYYQTSAPALIGQGSFRFQEYLWGPQVDLTYAF